MKIITNGMTYAVTTVPTINSQTVRLPLSEAPSAIGDTVELQAEDGIHLATWKKSDWLRSYIDGKDLVLTQMPESQPVTSTEPAETQINPIKTLATTVADMLVKLDKMELGVTNK